MAGKRINLLSQQTVNPRVHSALQFLRIATFALGGITVVVLGILFYQKSRVETDYQQYLTQKESLINEFSTKRETVQKVQLVALKSQALSGLLAHDPQFKNYYALLASTLPASTGSATINTFVVDKNKVFKTTVAFSNQSDAYAFMNGIESEIFKNVFSALVIDSVTVGQSSESGPVVVVNISGTFK